MDRTEAQAQIFAAATMLTLIAGVLLIIIAFDAAIVAAIAKHRQMFIKRNYFVLNVTMAELLCYLMILLQCIVNLFGGHYGSLLPSLVHLTFLLGCVRLFLLFIFMFGFVYELLTNRKRLVATLAGCWIFGIALYTIVFLACKDNFGPGFDSVSIYLPVALEVLVLVTYVISTVFYFCKNEFAVDDRVRFRFNSLHVVALMVDALGIILLGVGSGSMLVMVVEGIKCLCIVIMLMNTDANFKRALRMCKKNNGPSDLIKYDSLEELNV